MLVELDVGTNLKPLYRYAEWYTVGKLGWSVLPCS